MKKFYVISLSLITILILLQEIQTKEEKIWNDLVFTAKWNKNTQYQNDTIYYKNKKYYWYEDYSELLFQLKYDAENQVYVSLYQKDLEKLYNEVKESKPLMFKIR